MKKTFVVLMMVSALAGCETLSSSSGSASTASLNDVCNDYKTNAYSADKKWIGKTVEFTSRISGIHSQPRGYGFDLLTSPSHGGYARVGSQEKSVANKVMDTMGIASSTKQVLNAANIDSVFGAAEDVLDSLKTGQTIKTKGIINEVTVQSHGRCFFRIGSAQIIK